MQKSLKLSLAITVLLTVVALWTSQEPVPSAAVSESLRQRSTGPVSDSAGSATRADQTGAALRWASSLLEPASRDIFASGPPAQQAPSVPTAPPAPVASEPVVIPTPLPQYRFLGRMVTPEGQQMVYLSLGDQAVAVKEGDRMEDGWVVDQLDQEAVHLLYPSTQQRMVVVIAPTDQ